jgi:prefoldin subunit 5
MSYRSIDPDIAEIIKQLRTEIESLRAQIGAIRQNSIRLGNWVLEAVEDEKVKMTNVKTGAETFVGWATCDGVE